jgi:hypothetical protein
MSNRIMRQGRIVIPEGSEGEYVFYMPAAPYPPDDVHGVVPELADVPELEGAPDVEVEMDIDEDNDNEIQE